MTQPPNRADYAALSDRMGYLLGLRYALGTIVIAWAALRPGSLGVPFADLLAATAGHLAVSTLAEATRRRQDRFGYALFTGPLLFDGLYLAYAMYGTGGTQSPIRFLIYLDLVAVSLLASYRTGLKIALWHSLLQFVVLYAQAAQLVPPVDVLPGRGIEFDRMPVLNVTSFWVFAIATSLFSALNERELRNRRADLQVIVEVSSRLDDVTDPVRQSEVVLDGLSERFGFQRGLVLGASDDKVVALAARNAAGVPTTAVEPDRVLRAAWERKDLLPVKRLDPEWNPLLSAALPGARNLMVAPMIADGRPTGAIVVEQGARRSRGVERRVASVLTQFASIAALNLRNTVLLQHVQDLAERDTLTGAANRRVFQATLERILASGRQYRDADSVTAVLFVDLDDFKTVNDTLGHAAGDALLIAVTQRIRGLVRQTDLVARLGGDEFAILTEDDSELRRSCAMAERLVGELRAPYLIGEHHVTVTASIGIAAAHDGDEDASNLVRNADVAMYMAKANGKAGFEIFDPAMHVVIRERHDLSRQLGSAVELGQLRLDFQPIVDLESYLPVGVEALVRWQHPERGLIAPDRFIEIAEENGAILSIGRWVLEAACREAAAWQREGRVPRGLFVCVNVSAREIREPGFVDGVRQTLHDTGLASTCLILELTETALLKATPATIATLRDLRRLGVRIVIDDFGTGYFSLSHLRQFPVDALKIAREFVNDPDEGSKSSALAGAIVALGDSLGILTVAEGIQTADHARRMRDLGCTLGQGFYFSMPLPASEIVPALALARLQDTGPSVPARVVDQANRSLERASRTGRVRGVEPSVA